MASDKPPSAAQAARLSCSPTLALNQKAKELASRGALRVHFGFGQSPFPVPEPMVKAMKKHASRGMYLPSQGLPELREAAARYLAARFKHRAAADRIIVGPGSKELIFHAILLFDGPLFLPVPSWVSYAPQAEIAGKRVVWIETDPADGYRLTGRTLREACRRARSKKGILILNSPCNPTGTVYTRDHLREIADAARENGLLVVSDEIYAETVFPPRRFASIAWWYPEGTIVATGISKGFSAGGWRLGILLLPEQQVGMRDAFTALASETFSCVCAPVQYGAAAAFRGGKTIEEYLAAARSIHAAVIGFLWRACRKAGLFCPRPAGGFYLFPDFSPFREKLLDRGIDTDAALCRHLLEKRGLALLPGSAFGVSPARLAVRIAGVDYDGRAALRAFMREAPSTRAAREEFVKKHCPRVREGARIIRGFTRSLR